MSYELYIRHMSRAGNIKNGAIIPLSATFTITEDGTAPLRFWLNADNDALLDVAEYDIMQVYIRNLSIGLSDPAAVDGFIKFFDGVVRSIPGAGGIFKRTVNDDGIENVQIYCPHIRHILEWRNVAYKAGTVDRSQFTTIPAETIAKALVQYNCTASATTGDGRERDGDLAPAMLIPITIETDLGSGNLLGRSYAYLPVLAALQKINQIGGGWVTFTYDLGSWVLGWRLGLLGDDKTTGANRVLFSLDNGTITDPTLTNNPARGTVAIVGGKGEEALRAVEVVYSPQFDPANDIETFISATNLSTAEALAAAGLEGLDKRRGISELDLKVNQTQDTFYCPIDLPGKNTYKIGDAVVVDFGGEVVKKPARAAFAWRIPNKADALRIDVDLEDIFLP